MSKRKLIADPGIEDKPKRRPSAYNVFRAVVAKNGWKMGPHEQARFYKDVKKGFSEDFSQIYETSGNDATKAINEFLKQDSVQWKKLNKARMKFQADNVRPESNDTSAIEASTTQIEKTAQNDIAVTNGAKDVARPILRPRFQIGTGDDVKETPEQASTDVIRADNFQRKPADDYRGANNVVLLGDKVNEQRIRFREPLLAPRYDEHTYGGNTQGHLIPEQWNPGRGISAVNQEMLQMVKGDAAAGALEQIQQGRSIALSPDTWSKPDPYGYPSQTNYMIPVAQQPGPWERPFLPAMSNNVIGLKREDNTWRLELEPEQKPTIAALPASAQVMQNLLIGPKIYAY